MSEEFLVNFTPQETRVALMQGGIVQELHIERTASRGLVGNVYLGRVVRVLPGMQSAFIDLGLARTAFLGQSLCVLDVSRTLGNGPWRTFFTEACRRPGPWRWRAGPR